jgi:predicted deacetylase
MRVLVSIHDVTPAHEGSVRALWDLCADVGVCPALLVVPNWHGSWPLDEFPDFVGWIRDRAHGGSSILLHGYRHDELGVRRQWTDQLRAWGKTAREGEFLTLDRLEAMERIGRGLASLRASGLEPIGFVPPAWLARPETHVAAAAAGLEISEDDRRIYLRGGVPVRAPCLRWSTRNAWRSYGSALVAEGRWLVRQRAPVVRVALHPSDLSRGVVHRSLVRNLRRWTSLGQATGYADLVPMPEPEAEGVS